MEQKTILYIGSFMLPNLNAAANRVVSNAKILRDLGYNVVFLGVNNCIKDNSIQKGEYQGFTIFEIKSPDSFKDWLAYLSSIKQIATVIDEIGAVQIHSIIAYNYPTVAFFKLLRLGRRLDIKIISDLTEWYRYKVGAKYGGSLLYVCVKNLDSALRMRCLSVRGAGVIVISQFLNQYFSGKTNTVLLPPLVDLNEDKWKHLDNNLSDIKQITTFGMPNKNKESIYELIKVLAEISNTLQFQLNVIGVNHDQLEFIDPDLKKHIDLLGSKVNFLGRLTNEECIKILSKSHYFVFFRQDTIVTKAGFSSKFVESISSGCPVLTNNTSDIKNYLKDGVNGYMLDVSNEQNLKTKIISLLNLSNTEVAIMKSNCRNSLLFHYSNYNIKVNEFFRVLS